MATEFIPISELNKYGYGWGGVYDTAAYGSKPNVPLPTTTASASVPSIISTAGQVNRSNVGQSVQPFILNLPNYDAMMRQQSGIIGSKLSGEVPGDVLNQISQGAAERGIATGTYGSPARNADYLRALGLTSIGMQESGMSDLQRAIGEVPQPKLFDIEDMMRQEHEAAVARAIYASAPDPSRSAQAAMRAVASGMGAGGGVGSFGLPGGRSTEPIFSIPSYAGVYRSLAEPTAPSAPDYEAIPTGNAYGGGGASAQDLYGYLNNPAYGYENYDPYSDPNLTSYLNDPMYDYSNYDAYYDPYLMGY